MPERARIVELMYRKITGHERWYVDQSEAQRKLDSKIDEDLHNELVTALDDLYLSIVDRVDWNRIMTIAQGRCLHQKHNHVTRTYDSYPICGHSVRDAMCLQAYGEYRYTGTDYYTPPKGVDWVKPIVKVARKRKFLGT